MSLKQLALTQMNGLSLRYTQTASVSARTSRDQLHTSPGDMEAPLKAKSHERSSGPKPKAVSFRVGVLTISRNLG